MDAVERKTDAAEDYGDRPRSSPQVSLGSLAWKALTALASLRLTVVLFVLAIVLVFCGTLAQRDAGLMTVVSRYFRSAYVWVPFRIFFPPSDTLQVFGGIPFPGGWLIGGALLVNLLAAHFVRFRLTWQRSGILILHSGIVVMMIGELITGLRAVEAMMTIPVGGSSNFVEISGRMELAIVDRSKPDVDDVVVIPDTVLRDSGIIHDERLPFDVELVRYMPNSQLSKQFPKDVINPATAGEGKTQFATGIREVRGIDTDKEDIPSAYVTFLDKTTSQPISTYLFSKRIGPQPVGAGSKTYEVSLRPTRAYKPYTIHLREFKHDVYLGTTVPRNFESVVRLVDPSRNENRDARIYMNHPLSYEGETFYQSKTIGHDMGTVLQVVDNPGWWLPYTGCFLVAGGMLVHFGILLSRFLQRRFAQ